MDKPLTYDWIRNDAQVSLCVDLNMHIHEAKLSLGWCVDIIWHSPAKEAFFSFLHDPIKKLKKLAQDGRLVAEETSEGKYNRFIWYVGDEEAAQEMFDFCQSQKKHQLTCEIRYDAKWSLYYDEFYPATAQWQTIHNGEFLELRRREGDDASRPRPVKHEAYFYDDMARKAFLEAARRSGFAIEKQYFASDNVMPCAISLRHICEMKKAALDKATTLLITLVEKYGGTYGGWDAAMHRKHVRR